MVVVYPNSDPGGEKIIAVIDKYRKSMNLKVYKNIEYSLFLNLLQNADVLIGNSSGAITQSAIIGIPAINIGTRQRGREKSENIISCSYSKEEIKKALKKASNPKFRLFSKKCASPYGDGKTGAKVLELLSEMELDKKYLQKKLTY